MNGDSLDIFKEIVSFLEKHPKATSRIIAERFGRTRQEIEQIIQENEGLSLQEFRESRRLAQAFEQLISNRAVHAGPWDKERKTSRIIIPRTTLRYSVHEFWIHKRRLSARCPLVDLSTGGLAFLNDSSLPTGKRVSLLLTFPDNPELQVEGRVVYSIATGVAGYRYRIGIEFLPFAEKRGCNSPKVMETLAKIEALVTAARQN